MRQPPCRVALPEYLKHNGALLHRDGKCLSPYGQVGECAWAWVGDEDAPALAQLQAAAAGARWATLDARGEGLREGLPPELARALRRRRFLVEKARAASIVGARPRARAALQRVARLQSCGGYEAACMHDCCVIS